MSTVKNEANDLAAYKLAVAALRKKMAASAVVVDGEVLPVNGEIHVVLSGPPLSRDQQQALFGDSAISFPTVKSARKTSG